ncbi:MAG: SDR family NAD(P)-dependent oxidoreductase [Bermanella sp.]
MIKNFKQQYGQWAVVIGGTSGIGESLSDLIAQQGINIILVARQKSVLVSKANDLSHRFSVEVKTIQADLSDANDITKVIEQTQELDVGLFIPCAGLETHGALIDIPLEEELRLLQLNVISTLSLTRHFSQLFSNKGKGGILLVSSMSGHAPSPYTANYSGSKAYVLQLGLSLHWEMKQKGVDVTVLSPGFTTTPMTKAFDELREGAENPFPVLTPNQVANEALNALGKQPLIIPGRKNRFMISIMRRVLTTVKGINLAGKMVEKVYGFNR